MRRTTWRQTPGVGGTPLYRLYRYGFSAVLVINRVSILADFGHFELVKNRVFFFYSSLDMAMILRRGATFHHYRKENQQKLFTNYVYGNLTLV